MTSPRFAGKVAIVTGAGSGIGRAIAVAFAREGAKVVVSDLNEAGGRETAAQIAEQRGEALFVAADVSTAAENARLVSETVARFGALHVAVNNAGIGGQEHVVAACPPEEWDRVIAVNLSGVFYGMHAQIPAIRTAGGGAIVNMGSILSKVGFRGHAPYVAAKHGLVGLTRTAALEVAAEGIRINVVGPAFIRTPLLDGLPAEAMAGLASLHPIGRIGTSEEVAHLVSWLCSDEASFVTGSYYPVDGGYLAQ
jgi:NAD(P)-dependent dehydrogenase (short-subunit alcohol dehydrogenase family)